MIKFLRRAGLLRETPVGASAGGAALSGLPVPVLEATGGEVVPLNPPGEMLAAMLARDGRGRLAELLGEACATGRARLEVIGLGDGSTLYEFLILPLSDQQASILARDVTLDHNLRSALVESRQRYKDLVEISSDFAWETDRDGVFRFASPRGNLGYEASAFIGHRPEEFLAAQAGPDCLLPFIADRRIEDAELWLRASDGRDACVRVSSKPIIDATGRRTGNRGVWQDVSRERERETALANANHRERVLSYIVKSIRDVIDPAESLSRAAEAAARALGAEACQIYHRENGRFLLTSWSGAAADVLDQLAGATVSDSFDTLFEGRPLLGAASRYRHEVNGVILLWRAPESADWSDEDRLLLEGIADQIGIANEQIMQHQRIVALSRTDTLTGLFNRRAFFEELSRRFSRLERERKPAALIYIDLDNFKAVNDHHGHTRGDEALVAVCRIMTEFTRPVDLIARLGGDEFSIWLEGADERTAIGRCEEIIQAADRLAQYSASEELPLTMSLGVAVHDPERKETLIGLLQRADEAMYAAKHNGKCNYRLARPASGRTGEDVLP